MKKLIIIFAVILLVGCAPSQSTTEKAVTLTETAVPTNTQLPTKTSIPTATKTPEPTTTPTQTRTPVPTRTPRPYEGFYAYINEFGSIFKQVTELTHVDDKIKLHDIYFEKVDGNTTLFISLKNTPEMITDGSVLALPVTIIEDIRDNRKASLPKDIDRVVIASFDYESIKKLTINIKWSDLAEYSDGAITFNQFFTRIEQIRN